MIGEYVGWIRHGWTKWEPIRRLWGRLLAIEFHDVDGERLVLPRDESPILAS
jgi:hypothetical protein